MARKTLADIKSLRDLSGASYTISMKAARKPRNTKCPVCGKEGYYSKNNPCKRCVGSIQTLMRIHQGLTPKILTIILSRGYSKPSIMQATGLTSEQLVNLRICLTIGKEFEPEYYEVKAT